MFSVLRALGWLGLTIALASCGEDPPPRTPPATGTPTPTETSPRPAEVEPAPSEPAPPMPPIVAERTYVELGPDGVLGTWFRPTPEQYSALTTPECVDCDVSRLAVAPDGVFELDQLVWPATRPRDRATANIGIIVSVAAATTLYVSIGHSGTANVNFVGNVSGPHVSSSFEPDQWLVPISFGAAGDYSLQLQFLPPEVPPDAEVAPKFRGQVRFLDARGRPGAPGARFSLGTVSDEIAARLRDASVYVEDRRSLGESGLVVEAVMSRPGGGVSGAASCTFGTETIAIPIGANAVRPIAVPERGPLDVHIRCGESDHGIGAGIELDRSVAGAAIELRAQLAAAAPRSIGPARWRVAELERMIVEREPDSRWRRTIATDARRVAAALARGDDPFASVRGYQRMGIVSRIDGTAQPYELFVPPSYRPGRATPVVITLHGFSGNAGDYFRNTFGLARDLEGGETLEGHGRHGVAPTEGPMIVIGPTGRGQAHYRYAGEEDVLEILADVRDRFTVDERRIYVTGGSMGGTGAAYLPFRHPDLFAAAAALAGYHDQRVREDTRHDALFNFESHLQAERSDVDWAENALHLPMLLVRGTEDTPLDWTRSLVRRLDVLSRDVRSGYVHEHREPELGHNVWTETYAEGAIFEYFARYRRPEVPRRVRLRTARERHASSYWVTVDARSAPNEFAFVDARWDGQQIEVTTEHVDGLTLSPPAEGELEVVIDGVTLRGTTPIRLHKANDAWALGAFAIDGHKRPHVSGPIRDAYDEPLVFVVGTQDPAEERVARMVAEWWRTPIGWKTFYPIIRDTDPIPAGAMPVLVGTVRGNRRLAAIASRLPITIGPDAISVGGRRYEGDAVGTVFIAPDPESSSRGVLVISGTTLLGLWRSTNLPDLLPDYVVYDEHIEPARRRFAAGGTGATYLEAGFFGMDWSVPTR